MPGGLMGGGEVLVFLVFVLVLLVFVFWLFHRVRVEAQAHGERGCGGRAGKEEQ